MHASFQVIIPSDGQYHGLYALLLAQLPSGSYLPNMVTNLDIKAFLSNQASTVTVACLGQRGGTSLIAGDPFSRRTRGNNICLSEYTLLSSVGPLSALAAIGCSVDVGAI